MILLVASDTPHGRFHRAGLLGAGFALIVFVLVVSLGPRPLTGEALGDVYDVQARALMDGHWDVAPDAVSFERFEVEGRYYTYFGPWPSVLRMPVLALTDRFDGRLSRVSMMLAFGLAVVATVHLAWRVRSLVTDEPPLRHELVAVGTFVVLVGCGSAAFFLGSRAWVYHEAILWGVAWALISLSSLLAFLEDGSPRALALTVVAGTLGIMSRATVGSAAVLALAGVLVVVIAERLASRRTPPEARAAGPPSALARATGLERAVLSTSPWRLAAGVMVPVAIYAAVNFAKFRTLFGLPIDRQDLLLERPERQAALEVSGSLFAIDFAPTNLLQYFRPDAIGFDRLFPWVTFSRPPWRVGGVPFDNIEPSASTTATSTAVVVLALLGVLVIVRGRLEGRTTITRLRLPLLATAATTSGAVLLGVQFHRYQADFVPVLVLAAAAGLAATLRVSGAWPRRRRVLASTTMAVLVVWGCWATLSLTILYQRLYSPFQIPEVRAELVGLQLDVADALGTGGPSDVHQGEALPGGNEPFPLEDPPALGRYFIVGDCEALYVSSRRGWEPVEVRWLPSAPAPLCERIRADTDLDDEG